MFEGLVKPFSCLFRCSSPLSMRGDESTALAKPHNRITSCEHNLPSVHIFHGGVWS